MTTIENEHHYLSIACVHDECAQCPGGCRFCGVECLCPCHQRSPQ